MCHVSKISKFQNTLCVDNKIYFKIQGNFKLLLNIPIYHSMKFNYYKKQYVNYFVKIFARQLQQNLNFWILGSLSKICIPL